MMVTAEISLYPLTSDYEESIINFIKALKANPDLQVHTHAMSTFVKGEKNKVFSGISKALDSIDQTAFSFVMKLINRNLPVEDGFLEF